MEQFATEEQQVEAIKRFWKENGLAIVIGAILGLGALWGWRYYDESQIQAKESASESYQQLVTSLTAESGPEVFTEFLETNSGTTYSTLASLIAAQTAVNEGALASAAETLVTAARDAQDPTLTDLVNLRLARVYYGLEQYDDALSALANIETTAFTATVAATRGDVLVAKGDFAAATNAYQASLAAQADSNVQMRLDDVARLAAQAATAG
ncbi:MAG: tetratricopeptide repeat protein [Glaciecola sp.]|jgi:predicted negative regulator of RcsB-dependent stress response